MLGHKLLTELSRSSYLEVHASMRQPDNIYKAFSNRFPRKIHCGIEAENFDSIRNILSCENPDIVINCIGLIKQKKPNPVKAITINALLPHKIAEVCAQSGSMLIQLSTDCVFSGKKGNYSETDFPDASDLYGRSKILGELEYPHCLTIRTSIIGHELRGKQSLLEWFLGEKNTVKGFANAIFSGFPTIEIARIIKNIIMNNSKLSGLFHISSNQISKYDLLSLIAKKYKKNIIIKSYPDFRINRSLDGSKFSKLTGYTPPSWKELIDMMYNDYKSEQIYSNFSADQAHFSETGNVKK